MPAASAAVDVGRTPAMTTLRPGTARPLLRRAVPPAPDGTIVDVSVASAGWEFADIAAYRLRPGQAVRRPADDRERLVLVLEGRAALTAGDVGFGTIGTRESVFDGPPPPVVLVAPDRPIELVAESAALVVVASAPGGPVRSTRAHRARTTSSSSRAAPARRRAASTISCRPTRRPAG